MSDDSAPGGAVVTGPPLSTSHVETVEQVLKKHRSDMDKGLTTGDAQERLERDGRNEMQAKEDDPLWWKFLEMFKDPLILLLLSSAAVSILTGEVADAAGILIAVVIVNTVGFIQEYNSSKAVEALRNLTPYACHVLRDGSVNELPAEELVCGDIVVMRVGDRVPADCRVLEVTEMQVDESVLTGEAEPRGKHSNALETTDCMLGDRENMLFMGTVLTAGHGRAVVVGTGDDTELGRINSMIDEMEESRTPLQNKMDEIGQKLSILAFGIVGLIFVLGALQGKPMLQMFTIGVSLAVAAIPEGLPIVVTVTLALGVTRMARRQAIVRSLPAVEALGATTVICSDKTGTLTQNKMTVCRLYTDRVFTVHGGGEKFSMGDAHHAPGTMKKVQQSTAAAMMTLSSTSLGVVQLSDGEVLDRPLEDDHLAEVLRVGAICNNAHLSTDEATGEERVIGQPTEAALLTCAQRAGMADERDSAKKLDEVAFSSLRKWMGVQVTGSPSTPKPTWFIKGAVEEVLKRCTHHYRAGGVQVELTSDKRSEVLAVAGTFGDQALRVIALATGSSADKLCFVGLQAIMDPPKAGVRDAVQECAESGVRVVMITGDSKATAIAMAKELCIYEENSDQLALSHADLSKMTDDDLQAVIEKVSVFYRVAPDHKLRIVRALQAKGHIVAMTGDGVNDAPALKASDIGIAMGAGGTDVAKEASRMILTNDNFATIVAAIEEGKSIYANIMNFLRFQLTTSIATLSIVASSTLFGLPLPLNPIQVLWINVIMDGPPAQSLGVEPLDRDVMKRPPRDPRAPVFDSKLMKSVALNSFVMVVGTLVAFAVELDEPSIRSARANTVGFTTFVLFQLFNAANCRSNDKSIFELPWSMSSNSMFLLAVGGSAVLQLAAVYLPLLQQLFETEPLSLSDLMMCTCTAASVLVVEEVRKMLRRRRAYNLGGFSGPTGKKVDAAGAGGSGSGSGSGEDGSAGGSSGRRDSGGDGLRSRKH